jgi:hypothetical protein
VGGGLAVHAASFLCRFFALFFVCSFSLYPTSNIARVRYCHLYHQKAFVPVALHKNARQLYTKMPDKN